MNKLSVTSFVIAILAMFQINALGDYDMAYPRHNKTDTATIKPQEAANKVRLLHSDMLRRQVDRVLQPVKKVPRFEMVISDEYYFINADVRVPLTFAKKVMYSESPEDKLLRLPYMFEFRSHQKWRRFVLDKKGVENEEKMKKILDDQNKQLHPHSSP